MIKPREMLESALLQVLDQTNFRARKQDVEDMKTQLLNNYDMKNVQKFLNNPEKEITELDVRELMLISEQIYLKTKIETIHPHNWFTENDIDESRQFSGNTEKFNNKIVFPIVVENASIIGNAAFHGIFDMKTLNELLKQQVIYYDPELQREPTKVKRKNIVITQPTLKMKNVEEISNHLLEGTLVPTTLVLNAQPRTAESGNELDFISKNKTLEINKGTRLAIVDGFHRLTAIQHALLINPELEFNFSVIITNYSKKKAQAYQSQIAKATPISKVRIKELEASRISDLVVQTLKEDSELKGRIANTERPNISHGELVTYSILSDTIDEEFDLNKRIDAEDVGEFLTDFFNYLIGRNEEEFINNPAETQKESLINSNPMFIGYITLASRMYRNNIKAKYVTKFIKNIDFNRDNPLWKEIGLLDDNKWIHKNFYRGVNNKNKLKKIFENINLSEEALK